MSTPANGPQTALSDKLHAFKYRQPGETFRQAMSRIAWALKDNDEHFHQFRDILLDMRFMPGGRIQSAMGAPRRVTAYNCFVSGPIADTMTGGEASIMGRASQAATTMRLGGGIGYDFSTLRPRGALIRKLQSTATGPVSFMNIFDAVGRSISSSGHRRGAQMGVLRVDHPDIVEFVNAKQQQGALTGFNISVGITDAFMRAVENNDVFPLVFDKQVYGEVEARALFDQIMRSTWDWAEPGVLFIDTINDRNNLSYCEKITATNPCAEQPLPPFGACLLGSFNLVRYLILDDGQPVGLDLFKLQADVEPVVRAMDNVIDRTSYPLFEQEEEAQRKRRMGLGITGLATALEALGMTYGSEKFLTHMEDILLTLRNAAYSASADLAAEKGAFPMFEKEAYLNSYFVTRLSSRVRDKIAEHGIRNSHLLSIAPTGTISLCADNISSGIEPVLYHEEHRTIFIGLEAGDYTVQDYGYAQNWGTAKLAGECSVKEHLAVHEVATRYVDSAVSKTVNVDGNMPWEDFKQLYFKAWKAGAKGLSTFNADGKRMGIRKAAKPSAEAAAEPESACTFDPTTGRRECA